MKKLVALACAAALTVTAVPVLANPSIADLFGTKSEVTVVNTTVEIPEGESVVVTVADAADYVKYPEIQEVITKLLDKENSYTVAQLIEAAGIALVDENGAKKEYKTTDGNAVDPEKLEAVTTLTNFEFAQSGKLLENGSIETTIPGNEVLKEEKKENVVIVQFDLEQYDKKAENEEEELAPYFIEAKEIQEDGSLTAEFPCTGPFIVTVIAE